MRTPACGEGGTNGLSLKDTGNAPPLTQPQIDAQGWPASSHPHTLPPLYLPEGRFAVRSGTFYVSPDEGFGFSLLERG